MKTDVFSFTQGEKRTLGFMSVALGLMADLDRTEHLRFMGSARFVYGFIRGRKSPLPNSSYLAHGFQVVQLKPCTFELSFHAVETDKANMMKAAQERNQLAEDGKSPSVNPDAGVKGGLPPLRYLPDSKNGWSTVDKPMLYAYAGQGPYVSKDYMTFPVSVPDDGLLDLVICEMVSSSQPSEFKMFNCDVS